MNESELGYAGKYLQGERPNLWHKFTGLINPALITRQVMFSDVSFYQGEINWGLMSLKSQAAIIRAGQRYWADTQFKRNWAEAKRVGMKRGAYWFFDDRESPANQAQLLASLIGTDRPEMEIFVDYELVYGGGFQGLGNVVAMMQQVEKLLPGARVGIYTGYYFFNSHADPKYFDYLRARPLWLAWYTLNPDYVQIPQPWLKLTHWQWGTPAVGKEWGVQSNEIDMNYYNGTATEFSSAYGGSVLPPPPDPPQPTEEPTQQGLVTAFSLNVRSGPGTAYGIVGSLYLNDIAYGNVQYSTNWMHISKIRRADGREETLDGWASAAYMQVSSIITTPPGEDMQTTTYANGVVEVSDYQYASSIRILIVPPDAIKSAVFWRPSTADKRDKVQNVEGDIVFNFTPFSLTTGIPNVGVRGINLAISYKQFNPFGGWSGTQQMVMHHKESIYNTLLNVSQGFRYVIENGVKNPNWALGGSEWDELHPRRFLAATKSGATVIVSVAGRDIDQRGMSLHEAAELFLTHDAFKADPILMAIDGDGGASVQDYLLEGDTKKIFLGVPPSDQRSVSVFGIIKFKQPITGPVEPPPPPTTDAFIEPITFWVDGVEYRTVGDKIPVERVG